MRKCAKCGASIDEYPSDSSDDNDTAIMLHCRVCRSDLRWSTGTREMALPEQLIIACHKGDEYRTEILLNKGAPVSNLERGLESASVSSSSVNAGASARKLRLTPLAAALMEPGGYNFTSVFVWELLICWWAVVRIRKPRFCNVCETHGTNGNIPGDCTHCRTPFGLARRHDGAGACWRVVCTGRPQGRRSACGGAGGAEDCVGPDLSQTALASVRESNSGVNYESATPTRPGTTQTTQ